MPSMHYAELGCRDIVMGGVYVAQPLRITSRLVGCQILLAKAGFIALGDDGFTLVPFAAS